MMEPLTVNTGPDKKLKVLLEMRPALDGFAGIPQEVRLLFRGLAMLDSVEIEGMLQSSHSRLANGIKAPSWLACWLNKTTTAARRYNRFAKVIISLDDKPRRSKLEIGKNYFKKHWEILALQMSTLLGISNIKLTRFESKSFEDFTWRTLFAKTLPATDFVAVAFANHRVCSVPWKSLHSVGLGTYKWRKTPKYAKLDSTGYDVFIGQTPYPARVAATTAMVIRYHDAIPVFMPHTISDKSLHQSSHFNALLSNVKSGAWFACVSEATRQDLLRLFPEAASKAVTIHNMISHNYFIDDSPAERVAGIIRVRLHGEIDSKHEKTAGKPISLAPKLGSVADKDKFYTRALKQANFKYLLIVSTIEPRKNHVRLLAAWELIKAEVDPDLKLIVVGDLGWDYAKIVQDFSSWIDRGDLFMLNAVPAADLRILYKHAAATICPSLGEGFDFSGVESMACGGITIASDIPVHREVYDQAAEYFDPYATQSLINALKKVLYAPEAPQLQAHMRQRGEEVSSRYLPAKLLPQWEQLLQRVVASNAADQS